MINNTVPCYQCKDRKAGCHSTCQLYKTWRKAFQEERKKRIEEHKLDTDSYSIYDVTNRRKSTKQRERRTHYGKY